MAPQASQEDGNAMVLNGHVATLRFLIDYGFEPGLQNFPRSQGTDSLDEAIVRRLYEAQPEINKAVRLQIAATLGPGFDLESLIIKQGSIEILAIIVAVSAVLRSYNDFVEQVSRAIENTRGVLRPILNAVMNMPIVPQPVPQPNIQGSWWPGTALAAARERAGTQIPSQAATTTQPITPATGTPWNTARLIVGWALVSNLLLLGILIAIILTRRQ